MQYDKYGSLTKLIAVPRPFEIADKNLPYRDIFDHEHLFYPCHFLSRRLQQCQQFVTRSPWVASAFSQQQQSVFPVAETSWGCSWCYIAVHFRGELESAFAFFRILSGRENDLLHKKKNKAMALCTFIKLKRKRLHVMEARGQSRCFQLMWVCFTEVFLCVCCLSTESG